MSRSEILAIRTIAERASDLPFETRGPLEIFERLARQFADLGESLSVPRASTGAVAQVDASGVATRDDFGDLVVRLLHELSVSGLREWENPTLERFLDGLGGVALDRETDGPPEWQDEASWPLFARLVVAATGYE